MDLAELLAFAIAAKKVTYVGNGNFSESSSTGSHDLVYEQGHYRYRDSYFGGTDFLGQEVIWHDNEPVWAMNYFGYILRTDLITPTQAGDTLKAALSLPNSQGRLLDNFEWSNQHGVYRIASHGTITHFSGRESITVDGVLAYALDYHGGLIKP